MNIFLKLLPYLIIASLGFGIYYGFKYMSSELTKAKEKNICLTTENSELLSRIDSLTKISNITVEQLEQIRKNEKNSLKYIADCNVKIDAMKLNEDKDVMLMKINNYEVCIAKNSLNPSIKCNLELQ